MIRNDALANILATCTDYSTVVELYSSDATPTDDGFDPNDAIGRFSAAENISFYGVDYLKKVQKIGSIDRSIGKEVNKASVQFSNLDRYIVAFDNEYDFEGLIMVIRGFSRSMSTELSHSKIEFVGRCDKMPGGNKNVITITAKFVVGAVDVKVPRRRFTQEDQEGRVASDPEFEGFLFTPQYGSTGYPRRIKSGGFLGWWNKKQVIATIAWSSFSDLDAGKSVPLVLGRSQLEGVLIGATDVGTQIRIRVAFCEGPISDIANARTGDQELTLSPTSYAEVLGEVGTANGPDDPTWVAPGYYSRTAHFRGQIDNSAVDEYEPVPPLIAVIVGLIVPVPGVLEDWSDEEWSDNPSSHAYYLLTSPFYQNLHENWIDKEYATTFFNFNGEQIFNTSLSDFLFVDAG